MSTTRFIGKEFKHWFGDWKRAIPVFAIMTIPVLYAGTFLWSFWDPYGHLDRLPVAVVNLDHGATLHGKTINLGANLVTNLKGNSDFKWQFVSQSTAQVGLHTNQYFMEIEVPANFSQQAVNAVNQAETGQNLKTTQNTQPKLISITNDRYNFITAIMGRNAMEKIKEQTAQGLTEAYSKNLIAGLNELASGVQTASNGAQQIASGSGTLATKSAQLLSGSNQLVSGSDQLAQGVTRGQNSFTELLAGNQQLLAGSTHLAAGLNELMTGSGQLENSANQLLGGLNHVQQGLTASEKAINQTSTGMASLTSSLQQYAAEHPDAASNPAFQKLIGMSQQLQKGTQQLGQGQQGLVDGANQLVQGQTQFVTGLGTFNSNLLKAGQGASELARNQEKLSAGAEQFQLGLTSLQSGSRQLASGASQLHSGLVPYTDGVVKVSSGAQRLADKLQAASQQTPNLNQNQLASVFAKPVGLTEQKLGHVTTYGSGFAPYFMALGLFVGALLMSIVVDFRRPAVKPKSGLAWFLSKFSLLATIGIMQALIADFVILNGLGLQVQSIPGYVGFSILTSLTFIAIVQFLVTSLANPGRFVAVLLLILQLTSSSGSYPSVLSPEFFQKIGNYLPMTYAINGFRYLIAGGDLNFMHGDLVKLSVFLVCFATLTWTYFHLRHRVEFKRESQQNDPTGHLVIEA